MSETLSPNTSILPSRAATGLSGGEEAVPDLDPTTVGSDTHAGQRTCN